mgnify:CR=1 FL=1
MPPDLRSRGHKKAIQKYGAYNILLHKEQSNFKNKQFMSVGKMGSKPRAGPDIFKLKTGFSYIT